MSLSVNQSPTASATTPDEAAQLISNAGDNAATQRNAVVQDVANRGAAHQAKSNALIDIARKSGFVEEKAVAFLNTTVDGQVKDVVERKGEGEIGIRQIHGGLTTYMLETSAPHDPKTAPYKVSAEIASGLGDKFLTAKAGMEATVAETERPRANIPAANVPGGGKPFPPPAPTKPSQPSQPPAQAPIETAPAPAEGAEQKAPAEGAEQKAPVAAQTAPQAPAAAPQQAPVKVAEGGKPAERKEEPRQG